MSGQKMESFSLSFSSRAVNYAKIRPQYPREIFLDLSRRVRNHELAWDVGTGSGQAACGLVEFFSRVIATDASEEQLSHAFPHKHIQYLYRPAERSSLPNSSVDLVTAACAAHWFNLEDFYKEVRRVLAPGARIAVWTYFYPETGGAEDTHIRYYFEKLLAPLLPAEHRYYTTLYRDLPFPFTEEEPPSCQEIRVRWNLDELMLFMGTYSTRPRYAQLHGVDPLDLVKSPLLETWGASDTVKELRLPLGFRIGSSPT